MDWAHQSKIVLLILKHNFIILIKLKMNLSLTDKVIIVTGGAKGIGEGISNVLGAEGAVVIIVGRSEADNNKADPDVGPAGANEQKVTVSTTNFGLRNSIIPGIV